MRLPPLIPHRERKRLARQQIDARPLPPQASLMELGQWMGFSWRVMTELPRHRPVRFPKRRRPRS